MRIATDQLHLDMQQQLATSPAKVRVDWAGNALRGRGMSADITERPTAADRGRAWCALALKRRHVPGRAHLRWALLLQLAALAAASRANAPAAGADADREGCSQPLCYTASKLEAERNHMVLHDISIVDTTRGITRIKADLAEANGPDLGDSDWVLTGHVQVFMPQGKLNADKATVRFASKRIASMSAEGAPAEFERAADAATPNPLAGDAGNRGRGAIEAAHGHAREINYDMERRSAQTYRRRLAVRRLQRDHQPVDRL